MINVFFPYYNCGDQERQKEIDLCLKNNIDNQHIAKLIVMIDDGSIPPYTSDKVVIRNIQQRPTYRLWIELSNELQLDGISVLCNSDIYFDETLSLLPKIINEPDRFLALSRWELEAGEISLHKNPHWSQDVWAFHMSGKLSKEMLASLDFSMGVPRCDNKIAYIFAVRGWKIYNPCYALRSIHAHETQLRTYHKRLDDRILGAIAYVYPKENAEEEASLNIDIWAKRSTSIKKVALNKAMERWIAQEQEEIRATSNEQTLLTQIQETDLAQAGSGELLDALTNGTMHYTNTVNFKVIERRNIVFFNNLYNPKLKLKTAAATYHTNPKLFNVAGLIPPVIRTYTESIGLKPADKDDINFWQYPCATEKQAYENHLALERHQHINTATKVVNTYIPLPWATYIDKKSFPETYLARIKSLIAAYRAIAEHNGFALKVHSVCQHIRWVRILNKCEELGITDLHFSHKDSSSNAKQAELGTTLKLRGWPLIAVNYEVKERAIGMERKPIAERRLLASFIGAHMPHYLDDSRIKLFNAAKEFGNDNIFVDLGNEWHFNKLVYEEQVLNKKVAAEHLSNHDEKTFKYNTVLSDSKFSLCPAGAGPNTLRFWESIAVGSIPVIFSDDLAIFKEHPLGLRILENCILWSNAISFDLFGYLSNIDVSDIEKRQKSLISLYEIIKYNVSLNVRACK